MNIEYEYAKDIATWMAKNFYPESPGWEPCENLMGILTQIDNMVTGLTRRSTLTEKAGV